jgi:hypothetical protein
MHNPSRYSLQRTTVHRLLPTLAGVTLLAVTACGQAAAARPSDRTSAPVTQAAPVSTPTPAPPPPTPAPPTPTPAPPAPTISLAFGTGTVTVSVTGLAAGAHQVHVHRDCTGNPNLHITTLGDVFVNSDGSGSRPLPLSTSLRGRGYDLLVYPLGASQGPPTLCTGV